MSVYLQDEHLGSTDKYAAEKLLTDTGNDHSDSIWALPTECEGSFVLDLTEESAVSRIDIKNSGNNEFSFERGVCGYKIELSLDCEVWVEVVRSKLPSARGLTPLERQRLTEGAASIPWQIVRIQPTVARYMQFTVLSHYGRGAALNAIRMFTAESVRKLQKLPPALQKTVIAAPVVDLSGIKIGSINELNRIEKFFSEYSSAIDTQADSQPNVYYIEAIKTFHRSLVSCYHILTAGSDVHSSFAKNGEEFLSTFKMMLSDHLSSSGTVSYYLLSGFKQQSHFE